MEPPGSRRAPGGVVATPVHCRRCGYNLYGLDARRSCPECGLEAWESILHTVDPAASRLPKLRNPQAVGDALLWLTICMVAAALLVVVRPVAAWLEGLDPSGLIHPAAWARPELSAASGVAALLGLWAVRRLARPSGEEPDGGVGGPIWLLAAGLAAWGAIAAATAALEMGAPPSPAVADLLWLGLSAAGAGVLMGLRGVLATIGLRSREYRTARGGRQGVLVMVVAIVAIAAGLVLKLAARPLDVRPLADLGTVPCAVGTLMVVVGLLYLVMNAWWIRGSLRCPPPRLDEVLRGAGAADRG
jgi:hypothetical protein